ncbi:hypothetical protein BDY24DRAFT_385611 [Mrakia frigida]|uniref:tRNA (carboxymethyluridine(34)-5-O)-methyltransferase n=1 Tax=Mrakia frigida TaxID=29902 RepID=UPI003FCC0B86
MDPQGSPCSGREDVYERRTPENPMVVVEGRKKGDVRNSFKARSSFPPSPSTLPVLLRYQVFAMAPPLTVAAPPESPSTYEQQNVHDVYNQIATHFSATRYKPWPTIQQFLLSIPPGSLGLDAGCGNGKYLPSWDSPLSSGAIMVGLDRSENLAALARRVGFAEGDSAGGGGEQVPLVVHDLAAAGNEEGGRKDDGRRREVMVGDVLDLGGVREGSMDFAISIATLHHLSTPQRRLTTVRTFLRVLSPIHGRGMIHVWALEQGEGARRVVPEGGKAQDVFVPWVLSKEAPKTVGEALKGKKEKKIKVKKEQHQRKGDPRREGGRDARDMSVDPSTTEDSTPAPAPPPPSTDTPTTDLPLDEEPPRVYQRYYHLFKSGELQDLLASACEEEGFSFLPFSEDGEVEEEEGVEGKWVQIVKQGWDRDNWFCEIRRGEGTRRRSVAST